MRIAETSVFAHLPAGDGSFAATEEALVLAIFRDGGR